MNDASIARSTRGSGTRYLVRFDDVCPTMNWRVWDAVEEILDAHDVAPILAVVPDNHDPALSVAPPAVDFWQRACAWQRRGWTIGLHGYEHRYVTAHSGLIGLNARSEFAGIPLQEQVEKIRAGLHVFRENGVHAAVWVAPGHSFDNNTLGALDASGLRVISDGFYVRALRDEVGRTWIPQQLWRWRRMPFGTWTVCHHINSWGEKQIRSFARALGEFRESIVTVPQVLASPLPTRNMFDSLMHHAWLAGLRMRRAASRSERS